MLKPRVEKLFHVAGRFGNTFVTTVVGKMTKRAPSFSMNCAALAEFNGVIQPLIRDRKYHTKLGSWKSTAPNSISGRRYSRDCRYSCAAGKNRATAGTAKKATTR